MLFDIEMRNAMRSLVKRTALFSVLVGIVISVNAQKEKGIQFQVSGDFVSSYVWRGIYQGAQACVQPTLGLSASGFSLTAWGSTSLADIESGHKELDLTAAYSFGQFTVQLADLWWGGQGNNRYFHYENNETDHHFEVGALYTLPCEKFPLSIAWFTVFTGDDEDEKGKQQYSSYAELNYPFSVKGMELNATLGFVPYKSMSPGMGYMTKCFAVTNIALKATKDVRLSTSFSLPVYAQLVCNPKTEDAHLVLGFTIR